MFKKLVPKAERLINVRCYTLLSSLIMIEGLFQAPIDCLKDARLVD